MEVESVLVTGANRGIGLEFVRQLVHLPTPPQHVFATYRSKDTLQALEEIRHSSSKTRVTLIQMDITKTEDLESARKVVEDATGEKGLNLLISNAGAMKYEPFPEVTEENMNFHFTTNTVGPVKVLKEMLPLLQKAAASKDSGMNVSRAAVLNISSLGGSMGELDGTQPIEWISAFGYRTSKAALNMAMRLVSVVMNEQGILIVNMCPGWVRTDMGSEYAPLSIDESISSMMKTMATLNESHHGAFLDRNGSTIPF